MEIGEQSRRYWQYEYDVASRYMIPLLTGWGVTVEGASVLDVGCGEGGGMCAMHDAGAHISGFDVDDIRIAIAKDLRDTRDIPVVSGNMYAAVRPFAGATFDLVVLHDVFEHLEDKDETLRRLCEYLAPEGVLFITFPPYFSAYGAHQQTLATPLARLPFMHLIPGVVSGLLPRLRKESLTAVNEVQKLARLKMGMAQFEHTAERGHLRIVAKKAYLIGPNHIRFGLRPVPAGFIAGVPVAREVLCTGVAYLLAKRKDLHAGD